MADMGTRGPKEIDPLDISSWLPGKPKFPITGDGTPEGDKQALAYGMMPVPEVGFYQGMGGLKSIGDGIARAQAISYNRDMLAKIQSNQQGRMAGQADGYRKMFDYDTPQPKAQSSVASSQPAPVAKDMGTASPKDEEAVPQPKYASAPDSRPAIAGGSDGVVPSAPGMGLSSPPPAKVMMRPPMVDQTDVDIAPPMQVGGNMGNVSPADVPVRAQMPMPASPTAPVAAPAAQSADDAVPQPMHLDGRPNGTQITQPAGAGGVAVPSNAASWFNKPQVQPTAPAAQPRPQVPAPPSAMPDDEGAYYARRKQQAEGLIQAYRNGDQRAGALLEKMAEEDNLRRRPLTPQEKSANDLQNLQIEKTRRDLDAPQWEITEIGKDKYGNPIKGWANKRTLEVKGLDGRPMNPSQMTQSAGPDLHGDEFLKTLDPTIANQVKGIAEGRIAYPGAFALKQPYWQKVTEALSQYEPTADANTFKTRGATMTDMAKGKMGQNVASFNTAIGHGADLYGQIDGLGNWNTLPFMNGPMNSVKGNLDGDYQAKLKTFDATSGKFIAEMEKAFKGSGATVDDMKHAREDLNSAQSPAAMKSVVKKYIDLLQSRIDAVGDQYTRGMSLGQPRTGVSLLSDHAQKGLKIIRGEDGEPHAMPQGATQSGPKPGSVEDGHVFLGGDPKKPENWQAVRQ